MNSYKQRNNTRPQSSKVKAKNIFNDSKNFPSNIKQDNGYPLQKDFTSPNLPSAYFPSLEKNNRSKSALNESNDYKSDILNEEYAIIQKIWEDLGVTLKYQIQFDNYIKSLSESKLKNMLINEKSNLKRFGDTLLKLSKEINCREENIHSLKRYVFSLVNNSNYLEDEEDEKIKKNKDSIILNIISLIKSLRINSLNVITHFLKIREIVTYYNLVGKIDMKLINKEYNYDENYLIKMKNDMMFLNEFPQLSKYFDMNNSEIDPFLTNFSPNSNNYSKINNNKVKIPVSDDLKKVIEQCRYILIHETFLSNLKSNIEIINKNDNQSSPNLFNKNNNSKINNISSTKVKNYSTTSSKIQFFKDDENQKEYQNNYDNNFYGNTEEKEINKLMKDVKFNNMNRSLEFLRKKMGKDYNTLFLKNQDKTILRNRKNNEYNNLNTNNNNTLFRKPILGNNQIIIEREEKYDKPKMEFRLKNNFLNQKENQLKEENDELNRKINLLYQENKESNEEIRKLKQYVRNLKKKINEEDEERERIKTKRTKELKKNELENELKYKELDKKKDLLMKDKNNLNQKIKETNTLMEKKDEEYKQKLNQKNLFIQNQKEEYEQKLENKNNEIKNLTEQKNELINAKSELIKQKEQIINEKNQLIEDKNNLEIKINGLEQDINIYKNEMEKYNQLKIDYQNLQNKIKELENKIEELNRTITNLNQEKINIQNEAKRQINELVMRINALEQNELNLKNVINNIENDKQNLIKEKNNLILENNNLKQEINDLKNKNNELNNTKKQLEAEISELKEKINNLLEELNELKGKGPDDTSIIIGNYKYDFYKENLFNFITSISESLALDKIPDFLKKSFNLEKINIFDENTYIKGVYPKIITSKNKKKNIITGMCSLYYENYGQEREPLILRIEALCVLENDWEEQIENIIKYIKEKMIFDEIKYVISYMPSPEHQNKLRINQNIKELFNKKLNCVWKNLTNYADGSRTQDIRFIKEGNYFDQEESNYNNNNNKIFGFNTLSILSLFDSEERFLGDGIHDELKKKYSNIGFTRYINLLPIFILLANNPTYKITLTNPKDNDVYEIPEEDEVIDSNNIKSINPKNQIRRISEMLFNINDISSLKEKINSSELLKIFNLNDSLFEEVNNKLQEKVDNISFNIFTMNLNLSTTTNYCLVYENYYYNRISSKDIDILRDPETRNLFYLIPTKTESTFILLCQVSRTLQRELLDGHKNIYDTFMEYHPKLTNQLLKFSSFGLTTSQLKDYEKTIYIPSFQIDTHLFSYSMNDINKKGNIVNEKTGNEGLIGSVEEYFKMSFEQDKDIKNSFTIIPVEDNKMNMVIRESFLFGVFNINIIASTPLQLFYVTKDHWIKASSNSGN